MAPDPLALQQLAERRHLLDLAVSRLPSRCRTLVTMLFFEQPPVAYAEAAQRLGLAEGSIGFIRGRCLNKLRKQLRELGIE
jgi:DNA-directed RNA polymerase specialized sigma24 family protein